MVPSGCHSVAIICHPERKCTSFQCTRFSLLSLETLYYGCVGLEVGSIPLTHTFPGKCKTHKASNVRSGFTALTTDNYHGFSFPDRLNKILSFVLRKYLPTLGSNKTKKQQGQVVKVTKLYS